MYVRYVNHIESEIQDQFLKFILKEDLFHL